VEFRWALHPKLQILFPKMMRTAYYVLLIACLRLFVSCQEKKNNSHTSILKKTEVLTPAPGDFAFKIKGVIDKINSKDSTFTRHYLGIDSTVVLSFSQPELDSIYHSFQRNKVAELPVNFEPDCDILMLPTSFQKIELTFNGKITNFTYNADYECADKKAGMQLERMRKFLEVIHRIVYDKDAVKKMQRTIMVFM
jgi:hypothetical protein